MTYKFTDASQLVVTDGKGWSGLVTVPEVAAWISAGNTPAPATPVATPKPLAVTMRQARLALLRAGLLTKVNDAVTAMPGVEGAAARIEWEYSQEVQRDKALVKALVPVLGLTDAQLDALFLDASQL
ncbi:hypothetical protein [Polaromonas sp.]|uniref:hypothetical protein n=1 Tax=Polaromonas sp. TaxID=1869339 RepID=UPI00375298B9